MLPHYYLNRVLDSLTMLQKALFIGKIGSIALQILAEIDALGDDYIVAPLNPYTIYTLLIYCLYYYIKCFLLVSYDCYSVFLYFNILHVCTYFAFDVSENVDFCRTKGSR